MCSGILHSRCAIERQAEPLQLICRKCYAKQPQVSSISETAPILTAPASESISGSPSSHTSNRASNVNKRLASTRSPPSPTVAHTPKLQRPHRQTSASPISPCISSSSSTSSTIIMATNAIAPEERAEIEANAPIWHRSFLQEYRSDKAEMRNLTVKLAQVENQTDGIARAMAMTDSCEVRITGIPLSDSNTPLELALRVLEFIGLESPKSHVLSKRDWTNKAGTNVSESDTIKSTTSIVIELAAAKTRDSVLLKAGNLRDKTATDVFGYGGNTPIYINALWPAPVYKILREARRVASLLHYASPIVLSLVVHMRETRKSDPIPIYSISDLKLLKPRPPPAPISQDDSMSESNSN